MYTLYPSKSIKRSNYGEFLEDNNVLLMYTTVLSAYKYAPNLESLLTQQYVCVMCTLWSDNTCIFTRFYSVKNANTQLIWSSVNSLNIVKSQCCYQTIKEQCIYNSLSDHEWWPRLPSNMAVAASQTWKLVKKSVKDRKLLNKFPQQSFS